MNRLFFSLVLSIFFSALICKAETVSYNKIPSTYVPTGILNKQDLQPVQDLGIIKINYKLSDLKRKIALAQIERDLVNKEDSFDLNTKGNKYAGFLSAVSPEYTVKKGFLSLTKVSVDRNRRALMFVFLMNQDKVDSGKLKGQVSDNHRTRVHVLWPGSKKIKLEQRLIEHEYPVDVSIANYEDGYAAGEWNLVLPTKKPREVKVSLLWSF